MTWLRALCIVLTSPYSLWRRHEWRKSAIDRSGLWPIVTIGWFTCDALGQEVGKRLTEISDRLRVKKTP